MTLDGEFHELKLCSDEMHFWSLETKMQPYIYGALTFLLLNSRLLLLPQMYINKATQFQSFIFWNHETFYALICLAVETWRILLTQFVQRSVFAASWQSLKKMMNKQFKIELFLALKMIRRDLRNIFPVFAILSNFMNIECSKSSDFFLKRLFDIE